jgi:hypothetical protein
MTEIKLDYFSVGLDEGFLGLRNVQFPSGGRNTCPTPFSNARKFQDPGRVEPAQSECFSTRGTLN